MTPGKRTRPQPPLIIFDLGRVLIRICDGWPDACRIAGVPLPSALSEGRLPKDCFDRVTAISHSHEKGWIDNEAFFRETALAVGLTPTQVEACSCAWLRGPFPGVDDFLARLAARHQPIACLSNTNAIHWDMMHHDPRQRLPMHLFRHRFASHLIGTMKPDPAIYAHVESAAGVTPSDIIFFDDHAPNIAAAQSHGWNAVQINTAADPVTQMSEKLASLALR